MLEKNLNLICKIEAGEAKEDSRDNTIATEATVRMLTERTGKKEFTLEEILNPLATIKKYDHNHK